MMHRFRKRAAWGLFMCGVWGCATAAPPRDWDTVGSMEALQERVDLYATACASGVTVPGCEALVRTYDDRPEIREALGARMARMGRHYETGANAKAQGAWAVALYVRACDGGDRNACVHLTSFFPQLKGMGSYVAVRRALQSSCVAGKYAACVVVGEAKIFGLMGTRVDARGGVALLRKACGAGTADACVNLGRMYLRGHAVQTDIMQAAQLASKACESGEQNGCVLEAQARLALDDEAQDLKARGILDRQCAAGSGDACHALGSMTLRYKGLKKAPGPKARRAAASTARKLFAKSCGLGCPKGCMDEVNVLVRTDDAGMPNMLPTFLKRVRKLSAGRRRLAYLTAKRACMGANAYGCRQAALLAHALDKERKEDWVRRKCVLSAWEMDECPQLRRHSGS